MYGISLLTLAIVGMVYNPEGSEKPNNGNNRMTYLVPLKGLEYNVNIANTVAEIELIQYYHNTHDTFIETDFLFPVSIDAAFTSLEVHVRDKIIKSVVREKGEAKKTYEKEKIKGKFVGYAGTEANAPDIMRIKIGNIPPNEDVKVIFRYVESIEVQANKLYRLIISSTLTPRYYSRYHPKEKPPTIETTTQNLYPWSINVKIRTSSKITSLRSTTHDIVQNFGNENRSATISFLPNVTMYPNRNFVLLYSVENLHLPSTSLTRFTTTFENKSTTLYCAHLSFLPDLVSDNVNSIDMVEENKFLPKYTRNYNDQRGEFIFVFDRSGSMDGGRILKARDALASFIMNLPPDSYFDILSFGSRHTSYSKGETIRATPEEKEKAASIVKSFRADMGGTEIYDPMIEALLLRPPRPNYPRYIFLLTDGDVGNTESIVTLVENNNKLAVVNTMGIGSGASENLIKEVARAGRGSFEFVTDNEDFTEKVSFMLKATFIPVVDSIRLTYDQSSVVMAVPNPIAHRYLTIGEIYHVFLFYNESAALHDEYALFNLSYDHPQTKKTKSIQIALSFEKNHTNDYIPKFGVFHMIKNLERYKRNRALNKSIELDAFVPIVDTLEEIDQFVMNLSLHYQVLSEKTAFLVTSNETVRNENQTLTKVSIPNLESVDYYKNADAAAPSSAPGGNQGMAYYSPSLSYSASGTPQLGSSILSVFIILSLIPFIISLL